MFNRWMCISSVRFLKESLIDIVLLLFGGRWGGGGGVDID
jgi:hypothetical protein